MKKQKYLLAMAIAFVLVSCQNDHIQENLEKIAIEDNQSVDLVKNFTLLDWEPNIS